MLKEPDKLLPVTTDLGFEARVSTGLHGNFTVEDSFTKERYFNPLAEGQSFFRVAEQDVISGPKRWEQVEDKALKRNLVQAKYAYVNRYFE